MLLPQHQALIDESAIRPDVAMARGYRSIEIKADLACLGFARSQQVTPALLVPIWDVRGDIGSYLIRPDQPRVVNGRPRKYEIPRGSRVVLDVPPGVREHVDDPARPLFITEGARKADAAVSADLCCVSLIGVWNWRGTNDKGGKTLLADFEAVALNGREVYVVFDSDVMQKIEVYRALERLTAVLKARDAEVRLVYLPSGPGGVKVGLDDFLASGATVDDLLAGASRQLREHPDAHRDDQQYEETSGGILWHKGHDDDVRLTNFQARIVTDLVEDDGAEQRHLFEIEAKLRGERTRFSVPAERFAAMHWPVQALGAGAIVEPGMGLRDRARHAVQALSGEVPRRVSYAHLGWRRIDDEYCYLHAGGAIAADGVRPDVMVTPGVGLQDFCLPEPPTGNDLVDAVRASLAIWEAASEETAAALVAAVYRAPLGLSDFGVFIVGATGAFKTALAALAQQHWGAALGARNLPAGWESTANALEGTLFAAKDALVVIDDFAPSGSLYDVQRAHRDADRVYRGQGNRSGRGRMRADGTLRPTKRPRGIALGTGEDLPRGQSLRARMWIIEADEARIDTTALTRCQDLAAQGLMAQAMAAYICWRAGQYDESGAKLRTEVVAVRDELGRHGHRRTADILANLLIGYGTFLRFAVEHDAIDNAAAEALLQQTTDALRTTAARQEGHHVHEEPARRFIEFLRSAIASGRAHVANRRNSGEPNYACNSWGWRQTNSDSDTYAPQGRCVGWIEGDDLYLDPEASYAAVQQLARDSGQAFPTSPTVLRKRLHERGWLVTTDLHTRETLTVRRSIATTRREVLHLRTSDVAPPTHEEDAG